MANNSGNQQGKQQGQGQQNAQRKGPNRNPSKSPKQQQQASRPPQQVTITFDQFLEYQMLKREAQARKQAERREQQTQAEAEMAWERTLQVRRFGLTVGLLVPVALGVLSLFGAI